MTSRLAPAAERQRKRRESRIRRGLPVKQDIEARLWSKTIKGSGCWVFTGHSLPGGYGQIRFRGGQRLAHRVSWILVNGEIPDGIEVCHRCDNPPCIRLDHLFLGTPKENKDDCLNKGRQAMGERHGTAKLTEAQAAEIIRRRGLNELCEDLAEEYGVSANTIFQVGTRTWLHLVLPAAVRS